MYYPQEDSCKEYDPRLEYIQFGGVTLLLKPV